MAQERPGSTRPIYDDRGTLTAHGSSQTAATPDWKGNDRFDVVRRIGQGGMGVVYEAFDRERGQAVALKSLLNFTPGTLFRFKQEFRTLADVQHPNLVRLHELVVTSDLEVFFTMELVSGTDFLAYVQNPGARAAPNSQSRVGTVRTPDDDSATALEILDGNAPGTMPPLPATSPADLVHLRRALRQLVQGVMALHAAGKLHRDIKPSNVLVDTHGRVVILDFGVATELSPRDQNLSEADEIVGTVRYMSPEQAVSEAPTPASDWYSVGVVLYEALTGRTPFFGSAVEVLTMKMSSDPVPPSECVGGVPPELDLLCRELLDRDPEKRPQGPDILKRLGASGSARPVPSLVPAAAGGARAAGLVGRERQLKALDEAFERTLSGHSVTMRVAGGGGMGKSAVVAHFLDGLAERGEALVLRGRAYERESVPYKAVDTVIDALSRHLVHLQETNDSIALPADIGALTRVFPVLKRVTAIAEMGDAEVSDPNLVRRRAFSALRALLETLCTRQPVVIYVDDVQWGDSDSAALLLEVVRPPDAPPVLLIMTNREEEAAASSFLREMSARWPEGAEAREVTVGPLDYEEGLRLALALLDANGEMAQRTARAVARESRGSPFLIEELVRHGANVMGRETGETLGAFTLEEMVAQRLARLHEGARRLVEVLAVAGRPLPVSVVAQASGTGDAVEDAIGASRGRRFLRTGLRDGREIVEMTHDRFRETVVAQIPESKLREHHGRLAGALEATPGADAEAIATHLIGAGDGPRASKHAERAAEEAITKLALDQAARLLEMALQTTTGSPEEVRRLRARLASVLQWAGRGEESARAYLDAAEGAPPLERAELERAASAEFLASGRMVEGTTVLHRVLAAVGLSAPRTVLAAVFWLIVNRVRLAILSRSGFRYLERPAESIPGLERARVDSVFSAAMGFAFTNVVLGTSMAARSLVMALRLGDRLQVILAALVEASQHAGVGGKQGKFEGKLVEFAERLVAQESNPVARSFYDGNQGVRIYLRGDWKAALEALDRAASAAVIFDRRAGWQSTPRVFGCWSLNFLGRYRELAERHAAIVADAEQRGDLYSSVQLRDGSLAILWLVKDDPEGARRAADQAIAVLPGDRYLLQHWHKLYGDAEIELYAGDGAKAYARVDRDTAALKKSFILQVQHMRVQTAFVRGRAAIASLEAEPAKRAARLAETRRIAAGLEKEGMGWSAPFAAILRAAVANAEGDRAGAIAGLRSAMDLARAANMTGYENAARYQLGSLLGGAEGAELVAQGEAFLKDEGVRVPARFAATLVPGSWQAPAT